MLWAALLPALQSCDESRRTEALQGVAVWCLQFTPRVAIVEPLSPRPAVVMDVDASTRLFGGRRKLAERVRDDSAALGVEQLSWAPTSLAAVALARTGKTNGITKPLEQLLDPLPLDALTAVHAHQATLARLGCRTLGQVRALPRGGVSRRFDKELLAALDQAYGTRPEAHTWIELPEQFVAKLELMFRVELAPAMLFAARRLLMQLCGWLAARHSGVTAFTLRWYHDAMRSKSAGESGEVTIRTAEPNRNLEHLSRLMAENLAKIELLAPVGDLELIAVDVQTVDEKSLSFLPETYDMGESLALVLERIAARLGPERVLRPVVTEDHRLEWMTHWQPAPEPRSRKVSRLVAMPQPTFVLEQPLRLACRSARPMYQGVLQLLTGPHRVEQGWWDRVDGDNTQSIRHVARDYWVAVSEHAGVLWIFQTRLPEESEAAWFLHGTFA